MTSHIISDPNARIMMDAEEMQIEIDNMPLSAIASALETAPVSTSAMITSSTPSTSATTSMSTSTDTHDNRASMSMSPSSTSSSTSSTPIASHSVPITAATTSTPASLTSVAALLALGTSPTHAINTATMTTTTISSSLDSCSYSTLASSISDVSGGSCFICPMCYGVMTTLFDWPCICQSHIPIPSQGRLRLCKTCLDHTLAQALHDTIHGQHTPGTSCICPLCARNMSPAVITVAASLAKLDSPSSTTSTSPTSINIPTPMKRTRKRLASEVMLVDHGDVMSADMMDVGDGIMDDIFPAAAWRHTRRRSTGDETPTPPSSRRHIPRPNVTTLSSLVSISPSSSAISSPSASVTSTLSGMQLSPSTQTDALVTRMRGRRSLSVSPSSAWSPISGVSAPSLPVLSLSTLVRASVTRAQSAAATSGSGSGSGSGNGNGNGGGSGSTILDAVKAAPIEVNPDTTMLPATTSTSTPMHMTTPTSAPGATSTSASAEPMYTYPMSAPTSATSSSVPVSASASASSTSGSSTATPTGTATSASLLTEADIIASATSAAYSAMSSHLQRPLHDQGITPMMQHMQMQIPPDPKRKREPSPTPSSAAGAGAGGSSTITLPESVSALASARPFACPQPDCIKFFSKPSALRRHIRTHTGEKPYVCKAAGCNLRFAERGNLKRHSRVHSGEKPFLCDVPTCGLSFARKCHLLQHARTRHHDSLPSFIQENPDTLFPRRAVIAQNKQLEAVYEAQMVAAAGRVKAATKQTTSATATDGNETDSDMYSTESEPSAPTSASASASATTSIPRIRTRASSSSSSSTTRSADPAMTLASLAHHMKS